MSFIAESRVEYNQPWKAYVCLDEEDCKLLLPTVRSKVRKLTKNYEKWDDLHEGGEMTDLQATLMMKAEDKMNLIKGILTEIEQFLKECKLVRDREKEIIEGGEE